MVAQNQAAAANPKAVRVSMDSKAKVKIGNRSRGGKARTLEAKKADDHDTAWDSSGVPCGILNLNSDQRSIYLGQSAETSNFSVDCLALWWQETQPLYAEFEEWVIDRDGGSATRSNRTQLIKRMVELSQEIGITIRLVSYPPSHSKDNPIERCWAALENDWHGAILDSVEAALPWASHMTWKGGAPIVHLAAGIYEKSIRVLPAVLKPDQPFWQRSESLPKWDMTILPI